MQSVANTYSSVKALNDIEDMHKKLEIEEWFANGAQLPREKMPQIDSKYTDNVLMHLAAKYKVYKETVPLNDLKPTQKDYNFGQVKQRVANGVAWKDTPFFTDKNGYLLDGHHRAIQGKMTDPNSEVQTYRVNLPYDKAIRVINALKNTYRVMPNGSYYNSTGDYTPNGQNSYQRIDQKAQQVLDESFSALASFWKENSQYPEVVEIVEGLLKITSEDLNKDIEAFEKKKK